MRREGRRRSDDNYSDKAIKYLVIAIIITSIIIIGILIYSNILKERTKEEAITGEQISSILNKTIENKSTKEASSEIGKSVNESIKENNTLSTEKTSANSTKNNNIVSNKNVENSKSKKEKKTENKLNNEVKNVQTEKDKKSKEENKTELKFVKPVDGDIVRDFAKDSLIYSDTLDEWTTHMGIDIKADKTTIVKSAEKGTVKTIKNDPRYGLTIIIDHENGFQTVYSNLLTSEFVVEGEKVDKEQPIGTVGNTAAFEIADEPHLHFEILKDNVTVDPNIYLQN